MGTFFGYAVTAYRMFMGLVSSATDLHSKGTMPLAFDTFGPSINK